MKKISKLEEEEPVEEVEADAPPVDNMKNGEFVISISGEIGWAVTAQSITEQLEKADGQDVVIEIASPGGAVFEGVEIFNAIRNYEGRTEARIIGMAASMASYIPLAADKVIAEDNATFMIHNVWTIAMGDSEALMDEAERLESLNKLLAQEYIKKTGKSEKEVLEMMAAETWLYGKEIKKAGFVDGLIEHNGEKKKKKKEDDEKEDDDDLDKCNPKRKKDKDMAIAEAKEKFKSTLAKIKAGGTADFRDKLKNFSFKNPAAMGGIKMKKISKFAKWTKSYKESLPNSAFAIVLPGKEGASVRMLPVMDADGKIDVPHLRNAIVRFSQGKIELSTAQIAKARSKLMALANKYLKSNKETKSGKVIATYMSKFADEKGKAYNKIASIIATLREKAANKKPSEDFVMTVKNIAMLIEDLEDINSYLESEKAEEKVEVVKTEAKMEKTESRIEKKTEKKEEKEEKETEEKSEEETEEKTEEDTEEKEETEEKSDDGEEEKKDDDNSEEEESKFQEAMSIAKAYKKEAADAVDKVSKFGEELKKVMAENAVLKKEISKFKQGSYTKLLKDTVTKVSKFRNLTLQEREALEKQYVISKMSESALIEIGRITDKDEISKLSEPKETTKPTNQLDPVEERQKEFSKLSQDEQLEVLANANAKKKGFIR